MSPPGAHVAVTISGDLISNVRTALKLSWEYTLTGSGVRHGINAYTPHAFSAYISAVASVEAFLNEAFLGPMCRALYKSSSLWDLDQDTLEGMDILVKLVLVPQLLFDTSFRRNVQPLQDFALLVKVRNDIVHYKMKSRAPKYVAHLAQRGIAMTATAKGADYPWLSKLSCSEGIRWAHNTACRIVQKLTEFVPDKHKGFLVPLAAAYSEVTEATAQEWFRTHT